MKKQTLSLLVLAPFFLAACAGNAGDNSSSISSEGGTSQGTISEGGGNTSSSRGGDIASSIPDISSKGDDTSDSFNSRPVSYDALTEDYFNQLKNGGVVISGTVNWEFSGEVTDAEYGTTYDASEKVKLNKFAGQSSSTLRGEVRRASTSDEEEADANYSFRVFRNEKGQLTRLYLGADNKVHEVVYTVSDTDEDGSTISVPASYDTYFANPFTQIEYSDIKANKDGTYNITSYSADDFGIAALFFGETFDAEMKNVVLSLSNGVLHCDIETKRQEYEDDTSVYTWLTGSLDISLTDETDLDKPVPYEEVAENLPLKNAFKEIADSLATGGKGVTFTYTEKNGEALYAQDDTYMTPDGFVTEYSAASKKVPSGIAKYDNGKNYFFEVRNGKVTKSGTSDTLHLPQYDEDSLSAYIFQKDSENVYSVKTRSLGLYAADVMFDYNHKDNINGYWSSYSSSIQGTTDLVVTLKDGHVDTIAYNYTYISANVKGVVTVRDLGDTELGYEFKTKQLGPVQAGYEHFMGDFYSYDYGTAEKGWETGFRRWRLRIYGDGKYYINDTAIPDDATSKQGVLNGDTFTVTTIDDKEVALKYYPADSEFDLGYSTPTTRSVPVLYGVTADGVHKFTFQLDQSSEWNKDSGLVETNDSGEIA